MWNSSAWHFLVTEFCPWHRHYYSYCIFGASVTALELPRVSKMGFRFVGPTTDTLLPEPSAGAWHPPTPNNSCYIIYTSGTTAKPQGVVLEHTNMSSFIQHGALYVFKSLGPRSRFLLSSPTAFVMSCGIQFPTLSEGATLTLAPNTALLDELELLINAAMVRWLGCHSKNITHMLQYIQLFVWHFICITDHAPHDHSINLWACCQLWAILCGVHYTWWRNCTTASVGSMVGQGQALGDWVRLHRNCLWLYWNGVWWQHRACILQHHWAPIP